MSDYQYEDVGNRLREFGKRYGTMTAFAEALGMSVPNLNQYLLGRSIPGGPVLKRLIGLGCDITWLLTGAKHDDSIIMNQVAERMIALEKENAALKRNLGNILSVANKVEGLGLSLVADKKAKYSAKKKK